jgi:hypothetical protein
VYGGMMYFGRQDKTADAAFAAPGTLTPTPASDEISQILQISDELTARWIAQVTSDEWLYFSYKDDLDDSVVLGNPPIDPDNGWPLPRNSMWEYWYQLDDKGQQTTVIVQRTDLELGSVSQVVWQNGNMLKLPGGIRENTNVPGRRSWETYRPIWDEYCHSQPVRLSSKSQDEVSIKAEWVTDAMGINQWVLTMTAYYPPVISDAYPDMKVIGNKDTCYRNAETGALERIEQYVIPETGEPFLAGWTYDYVVKPLKELPPEIFVLLEQLNTEIPQQ